MSKPSIPKLAHGNYWDWAPMMEALLIKEDLWEVTFDEAGQAGKPISPTGSANSAAVKKWRRREQVAKAQIILNVDPSQLPHTRSSAPYDIWTELRRVHASHGVSTMISLRRQINELRKDESENMLAYITRAQHSFYVAEQMGLTLTETDKILALTGGLDNKYEAVIVGLDAIISTSSLKLETVIERLLNEESRQQPTQLLESPSRDEAMAVASRRRQSSGRALHRTSSITSSSASSSGSNSKNNTSSLTGVRCHRCGGEGHYRNVCPTPPKEKEKEREEAHIATVYEEDSEESDFAF